MPRIMRKKQNSVEEKFPRIKTSMFPVSKPDFRKLSGTKDNIIKEWLKDWITTNLQAGVIKENNLLPLKADLAYYFGVGAGTVQNAVRKLEDEGIVVSKQRIGTLVSSSNKTEMHKLTSKRDKVIAQIKNFIFEEQLSIGDVLPNMRELEAILNSKRNTIRSALDFLAFEGVLKALESDDDNKVWSVIKEITDKDIISFSDDSITTETLAQKISQKIEDYVIANCKVGDRLDSINEWAKRFSVSDKTAYDAMQILFDKGVIQARRGRYGTIVAKMPNESFQPTKEMSIFMPAAEAAVYSYKRIENFLRNKIKEEYSVGQKLPSMKVLSESMDVSTNTIRKAVLTLAAEGYLGLSRGRFGGIYVLDIPEENTQSFKWLAVNPQYVKSYR